MEVVLTVHTHWRKQTQGLKAVNASVCICGSFTKRHVVDSIYSKHRINECLIWKPINKEHAQLQQQQHLEAALKWCSQATNAIKDFYKLSPSHTHSEVHGEVCSTHFRTTPTVVQGLMALNSTKLLYELSSLLPIILRCFPATVLNTRWMQCSRKQQRKNGAFVNFLIPARTWQRSGGVLDHLKYFLWSIAVRDAQVVTSATSDRHLKCSPLLVCFSRREE